MVSRWTRVSAKLPVFPWDTLAEAKATAAAHPGGLVDLSVGTPVDPTPEIVREALAGASDAHGYPTTWGTAALRAAIIDYLTVRWQAEGLGRCDLTDPKVQSIVLGLVEDIRTEYE